MKHYIFLTTEGYTFAPNDYDEPTVENCQMLGKAFGRNEQHALENLLTENEWIEEAGFDPDEIFSYEIVRRER